MQQFHFQPDNLSIFFEILIQCNDDRLVSHRHRRDQEINRASRMARFAAILAELGGSIPKINRRGQPG